DGAHGLRGGGDVEEPDPVNPFAVSAAPPKPPAAPKNRGGRVSCLWWAAGWCAPLPGGNRASD
ncbi:hypothetical protein, partial [Nocardia wallacei]|uniref:hypothetical protein n=1 Tax=Nocardia wallacei TaxID=480035 RepID=UPI0024545F66